MQQKTGICAQASGDETTWHPEMHCRKQPSMRLHTCSQCTGKTQPTQLDSVEQNSLNSSNSRMEVDAWVEVDSAESCLLLSRRHARFLIPNIHGVRGKGSARRQSPAATPNDDEDDDYEHAREDPWSRRSHGWPQESITWHPLMMVLFPGSLWQHRQQSASSRSLLPCPFFKHKVNSNRRQSPGKQQKRQLCCSSRSKRAALMPKQQ